MVTWWEPANPTNSNCGGRGGRGDRGANPPQNFVGPNLRALCGPKPGCLTPRRGATTGTTPPASFASGTARRLKLRNEAGSVVPGASPLCRQKLGDQNDCPGGTPESSRWWSEERAQPPEPRPSLLAPRRGARTPRLTPPRHRAQSVAGSITTTITTTTTIRQRQHLRDWNTPTLRIQIAESAEDAEITEPSGTALPASLRSLRRRAVTDARIDENQPRPQFTRKGCSSCILGYGN